MNAVPLLGRFGLGVLAGVLAAMTLSLSPASAAYVHQWEDSFPVKEEQVSLIPLAAAVDNSGGPSDGDLYLSSVSFSDGSSFVSKFDSSGTRLLEFDGSGTPAGSFRFVDFEVGDSGIAVDSSAGPGSGDVYVADIAHGVIDRFTEDGTYVCQITGTPTPSASECNGLLGSALPAGDFAPAGLAVDPSTGVLYVADGKHDVILRFDAAGAYLGQISSPEITAPSSIAVDSTGALYVANGGSLFQEGATNVVKLSPGGAFLFEVTANKAIRIAVDLSTDRLYVAEGLQESHLVEYMPDGNKVSEFGIEEKLLAPSLAVDPTSGRIYATNVRFEPSSSTVEVYGRGAIVPDVITKGVSEVEEASALFSGSVDPADGGDVTLCQFEYVAAADYDPKAANPYAAGSAPVPCTEPMPITAPSDVTAEATALAPSTTYHFRLAAANSNGVKSFGKDILFNTKGAPTIDAQGVTGIERYAATLTASINPHGFESEFRFEFVDEEHYEEEGGFASPATRSTMFSQLGDGLKPLAVNQGISGLEVGTTYYFRAVARNAKGTLFGAPQTFTTVPIAEIGDQWAYAHVARATFEADVNPLGIETTCRVEYVSDAQFQESAYDTARSAPCLRGLGAGSQMVTGRAEVGDLSIATKYHFRFVVANDSGTLVGPNQTMTTFGIEDFTVEVVDAEGNPFTEAGGHPFASITHLAYNHTMVKGNGAPEGSVNAFIKTVLTEMPAGRVGSAVATPRCPGHQVEEETCPGDSQVGTITIEYFDGGSRSTRTRGLFNVSTPEGKASRFSSIDPYVNTDTTIRTGGDYGMTIGTHEITEEARIVGVTATIWGVPSDPRHDPERRCPGSGTGCSSTAEPLPLLRNPTLCGAPLVSKAAVDTWQEPGVFDRASDPMPAMVGCDKLRFEPSVEVRPTASAADSPSGMDLRIHLPQNEDPTATGTADLRDAVVDLPEGLVINPAVATGMVACSEEQIDLDGEAPASCPEAAKVGSARIDTPLLDHPLPGAVYIAAPYANPFGSLLALYVAVHDPQTDVVLKLAGKVDADPVTGRLTASFEDNPQLPFEDLRLGFFGGSRAMLRTPPACGNFEAGSRLTPWSAPESGPPSHPSDSFSISAGANGSACVASAGEAPHSPSLEAGSELPVAGAYSPFTLRLERPDGTQELAGLKVQLPPGVLARLAKIPDCPTSSLAAAAARRGAAEKAPPSCPDASAIGRVEVGAGAGPTPLRAPGRVYLSGPYKGAPLSLAVVVPALAGPYDLGTVVVRAALRVDPESTAVTVETDPLPRILEGIPLDLRAIVLRLDRAKFMLNPTSCRQTAVRAEVGSVFGATAPLLTRFRLGRCGSLGFEPRLGLRLLGETKRGGHPRMRAVLRLPRGGANVSRASVTLPPTQFLDNEHLRGICTREQFASRSCPPGSVYGSAAAWSPLLGRPVRGPVYLRSSNHRLPDLVADLRGQLNVSIHGRIDSARGGIRVNLEGIPDAPVSKFVLTMLGGGRGLLQNAADVCLNRRRAHVEFEGHNGKIAQGTPLLRAQC
jgi:DNA-binding beta-propeller fold protein YncE